MKYTVETDTQTTEGNISYWITDENNVKTLLYIQRESKYKLKRHGWTVYKEGDDGKSIVFPFCIEVNIENIEETIDRIKKLQLLL
jgi:hypothetical protein